MTGRWEIDDRTFRILVVCTGNICRSPLAEKFLQVGFDAMAPAQFEISSAGTSGLTGDEVTPQIARIANPHGITFDGFRARRLENEHIRAADLVLTMERAHRATVVQMLPAALRHTFTLREFARILPLVPPENDSPPVDRWNSLAALAQRYRRPALDDGVSDDVVDPIGGSESIHQTMFDEMMPAISTLLEWERRLGLVGA